MKGCADQGQLSLCIRDILLSLISVYKCQETSLGKTKQTVAFCIYLGLSCIVLCNHPFTLPQS